MVRYARARKETLDGQQDLRQVLLEVRRLVGVQEAIAPVGELPVRTPPLPLQQAGDRALTNRPDLLAQGFESQRAEAEIALRRREVVPNPSVGVFFTREGTGDRILVGGVSIPLPVFNRRQGELASLGARREQAGAEVLSLEQEIRKEVEQAISQWEAALQSFQLFQREIIERIEENLRLLETAYRERKIEFPQVLIMENDLISANLAYLDVALALRMAAIRLREVTGEGP